MKVALTVFRIFFLVFIVLMVFNCSQNTNQFPDQGIKNFSYGIPRLEKHGTATQLMVNGKPFLMISGELHNSTAGGFRSLRPVWNGLSKKNLNSVIATVSW